MSSHVVRKFETRLTVAFTTIDRDEDEVIYSGITKLRLLNRKIQADFLEGTCTNIELILAKVPVTITYDIALASYRDCINMKYPPRSTRRLNEVTGRGHGRGDSNNNNGG